MSTDRLLGREFARYRIEAVLGRGGMGVVYRARDLRLNRVVALKVLSEERAADASFRERFLRESRLLASIDHPNIVPIFEADEADGELYIAMRYVQGPELRRIIELEGPLAPARAVAIIGQVADALDAAHAAGLIHRDIKPANILVVSGATEDSASHAYLTDFGLTKLAGESTGLTQAGQFVGTPGYVAPEQIQGRKVDHRADIYALGCVLYDCLTGVVPYPRDSTMASLWAHVHEVPPKPSQQRAGLPESLDAVIAQALAKLPEERFQTAGGLATAARQSLIALGAQSHTPAPRAAALNPTVAATTQPSVEAAAGPSTGTPTETGPVQPSTVVVTGDDTRPASTVVEAVPGAHEVPTAAGGASIPPGAPLGRRLADTRRGRRPARTPLVGLAAVLVVAVVGTTLIGSGAFGLASLFGQQSPSPAGQVAGASGTPGVAIIGSPSPSPSTAPSASPSPTSSKASPSPGQGGTQPGSGQGADSIAPTGSVKINAGSASTKSLKVTLTLSAHDNVGVTKVRISNSNSASGGSVYAFPGGGTVKRSWTLSGSSVITSNRYVYTWFYDRVGHRSAGVSDSIKYIAPNRAPVIHGGTNREDFYASTYNCGRTTYCEIFVLQQVVDPDGDPVTLYALGSTANGGSVIIHTYNGQVAIRYLAGASTGTDDRLYFYVRDNHGHNVTGALYIWQIPS